MAKTTDSPKRTTPALDSAQLAARRKKHKALLGLLLLLFLTLMVGLTLWGGRRVLFRENPRFKLTKVEIQGGTFWRNREELLMRKAQLQLGVNLFALDYRALRKKIEKNIPSIEKCEIFRVLPDKLQIRVWERIPRLAMIYPRSPWVVDEHGVLMFRSEAIPCANLPIFAGLRRNLKYTKPGTVLEELQPALQLVMMVVRNFPDIRIIHIAQTSPTTLKMYLTYRTRDRVFEVLMPIQERGSAILLSALQTAIINARRHGDNRHRFDLRYGGRVVIAP